MKLARAIYVYRWSMRRFVGVAVADPEGETPGWVAVREPDGRIRRHPRHDVTLTDRKDVVPKR